MIIKVPIYVEIESISKQEMLPDVVEALHEVFTGVLRKEKFENSSVGKIRISLVTKHAGNFKIISKEKALEYLRTRK
jgi:hypothetical protein